MSHYFELTSFDNVDLDEMSSNPARQRLQTLLGQRFDTKEEFDRALTKDVKLPLADLEKFQAALEQEALVPTEFHVSEYALKNLSGILPKATFKNLKNKLAGRKSKGRGEFLSELDKAITKTQTKKYRHLLLQHCGPPFLLPYYFCPTPEKTYFVDVTRSIPPQKKAPATTLRLLAAFEQELGEGARILCDAGAGRGRNGRAFEEAGYLVYACEYDVKPPPNGEQVLPKDLADENVLFDAVLLSNVAHIIPFAGDRELLVKTCVEKLRDGGLLAWVTPQGDPHMNEAARDTNIPFQDGWILHPDQSRQSFYTEFDVNQVRAMLVPPHGLTQVHNDTRASGIAKVFQK